MPPPAPGDCFLVTQIPGPYHVRGVLLFHVPSFRLRWIFIILRPCQNQNVRLSVEKADGTEGDGPFLTLKGLNPRQIRSELESVYRKDALAIPTIYKWHARFRDGRTEPSDDPRFSSRRKNDLADAISLMSDERRFVCYQVLARHFRIATAICLRISHDDLGLLKFHLR
jgi:hypothetical protein